MKGKIEIEGYRYKKIQKKFRWSTQKGRYEIWRKDINDDAEGRRNNRENATHNKEGKTFFKKKKRKKLEVQNTNINKRKKEREITVLYGKTEE